MSVWVAVISIQPDASSEAPDIEVVGVYLSPRSAASDMWIHIADQGDFLLEEEATPEEVDDFWEELQRVEDPVEALHQRVMALTGRAWLYEQDWDWTITEHLVEEACEQEEQ